MLEMYCILITIILLTIIGYLIYVHKIRHIGDSEEVLKLTEKMNNNLKVYNKELNQIIRQMHTLRLFLLDITKEFDVENVMGKCEVHFDEEESNNEGKNESISG